jgi:hypothetical protein
MSWRHFVCGRYKCYSSIVKTINFIGQFIDAWRGLILRPPPILSLIPATISTSVSVGTRCISPILVLFRQNFVSTCRRTSFYPASKPHLTPSLGFYTLATAFFSRALRWCVAQRDYEVGHFVSLRSPERARLLQAARPPCCHHERRLHVGK